MEAFTFVILALASHRLQRIITADHWPPSERFRNAIKARFGEESAWYKWVTCPWCTGLHVTVAVFLEHHYLTLIPLWVYAIFAASTVVGSIGTFVDD